MPTLEAQVIYIGELDFWQGNGRRHDPDAACLFCYVSSQTTVKDLVEGFLHDYRLGDGTEDPMWNDVDEDDLERVVRSLVDPSLADDQVPEALQGFDPDGDARAVVLLELSP